MRRNSVTNNIADRAITGDRQLLTDKSQTRLLRRNGSERNVETDFAAHVRGIFGHKHKTDVHGFVARFVNDRARRAVGKRERKLRAARRDLFPIAAIGGSPAVGHCIYSVADKRVEVERRIRGIRDGYRVVADDGVLRQRDGYKCHALDNAHFLDRKSVV